MISVIIPVYNRKEYITETVLSVMAQTCKQNIEIIIVDDGSTDNSCDLIRNLQSEYPFLKLFIQKNKGVSSARNRGLLEAKGNFVQFLDSDDLISPNKFKLQLKALTENPNSGLCYCTTAYFKQNQSEEMKISLGSDIPHEQILPAFLASCQWQVHSPLYRRSACEKIGPWNENLTCLEDWEYGCRAGAVGIKPVFCQDTLAFTREHDGERLSHGDLGRTAKALKIATTSILDTLNAQGFSPEWFDVMARHMVAAGRAFISTGDYSEGEICLNTAREIAKNQKLRLCISSYALASKVFGYRNTLNLSRKLTNIKLFKFQ